MIYTVTLNPALDHTVQIECFAVGKLNRILSSRLDPGGRGINVARTLGAFHFPCMAMAILGGHNGELIAHSLEDTGIQCDFTWCETETRNNIKIVDTIMGVGTEINESGGPVGAPALDEIRRKLGESLQSGDCVAFSGSLPSDAPVEIYRDWIRECKARGADVFLDTSGHALALAVEGAPYCLRSNRMDLQSLIGYQLPTPEDVAQAGWQLLNKGITVIAASIGEEGALLITRKKVLRAVPPKLQVQSTVGAGDVMLAALIYSHIEGLSPEEAIKFAVAASSAKVIRIGAEPPEMADIQALLQEVRVEEL